MFNSQFTCACLFACNKYYDSSSQARTLGWPEMAGSNQIRKRTRKVLVFRSNATRFDKMGNTERQSGYNTSIPIKRFRLI